MKPLQIKDLELLKEYQETTYMKNHAQLQAWFMENHVKDSMIYKKSYETQFLFIREDVRNLFKDKMVSLNVISTHTSKSICLPVYEIVLTDGTSIIMRNNFYDWKVSFNGTKEINIPLSLFARPDEKINRCYCEGFDETWVYNTYLNNKKQYTVEIRNDFKLYTYLYLINENI